MIKQINETAMSDMILKYGARETGKKIIDKVLNTFCGVTSCDMGDTAIFADGLDEVESLLKERQYATAFESARQTAESMLEDEGMDLE